MVEKIATPTLSQEAYRTIRNLIVASELKPGQRIIVRELCERFGLSPTPFKEALVALERDGLVEARPRRGYRVAEPDLESVCALYEVRGVLEGLAARLATRNATPQLTNELNQIQDRHRSQRAAGDLAGSGESDLAFHRKLWDASGNPYLMSMAESFTNQAALMMTSVRSRNPERQDQALDEHDALIDCIVSGDEVGVENLMRKHVALTARALAEVLGAQVNDAPLRVRDVEVAATSEGRNH